MCSRRQMVRQFCRSLSAWVVYPQKVECAGPKDSLSRSALMRREPILRSRWTQQVQKLYPTGSRGIETRQSGSCGCIGKISDILLQEVRAGYLTGAAPCRRNLVYERTWGNVTLDVGQYTLSLSKNSPVHVKDLLRFYGLDVESPAADYDARGHRIHPVYAQCLCRFHYGYK